MLRVPRIRYPNARLVALLTAFAILTLCPIAAPAGTVEGFTEPFRDIEVSAPGESGMITRINVREGQRVKLGDLLLELDTRVLDASLNIARSRWTMNGRVEAAQAEFDLRSDRLERLQQLSRDGHASSVELRRAATDLSVSQANLKLAREEKTLAKLECERIEAQIAQRQLRSPISGVVVDILREEGESTRVNDSELLRLVQLDRLRVRLPVSVQHAATVTAGETVTLTLPEASQSTSATVEVVSPVLDAKSGTVEITCVIDNTDGHYRSGMRCLMEVEGSGNYQLDYGTDDFDLSFQH